MTFIEQLESIILDRKQNPSATSYTTSLFEKGEDAIVQKVGEEAVELIIAAKGQGKERVISETADLLYHLIVLLAQQDVSWQAVQDELAKRHQ